MPLVQVYYDQSVVDLRVIKILQDALPTCVVKSLNCYIQGDELKIDQVSVAFKPRGQFDINFCPLEISVFVNNRPELKDKLEEMNRILINSIRFVIDKINYKFSVWFVLLDTNYLEQRPYHRI